jgi:hypothetical protein
MTEKQLLNQILLDYQEDGFKLFRNNVGMGYNEKGTPIHYGLCKGSGDLIGWRSVVITPNMVGKTIAQFASIEAKTCGTRITDEQLSWHKTVEKEGGYSEIVIA